MPRAPLKPCAYPGCAALVERGETYCPAHSKQRHKADNRKSYRERGYNATWDKLRKIKMWNNPVCEMCKKEGRTRAAEIVHHIKPLEEDGELLDMGNLMSVCRTCHGKLHKK